MRPSDAPLLLSVGWLAETPQSFQEEVLARCMLRSLNQREAIYQLGDETGGVIGVLEGSVEMHVQGRGDGQSLGLIVGPGFWMGDLAALTGRPRRIGLVARSRTKVVRLLRNDMLRITEASPECWRYFALMAARSLAIAIDLVDALKRDDPMERVGRTLLNLLASNPTIPNRVEVSQTDLGLIAGLSRGTTSASLAKLEQRGWIRRSYSAIAIVNLDELSAFILGN